MRRRQEPLAWCQREVLSSRLVCSSSQLAPRIGLYTASLVSLREFLIGWRASDCDAPTHIVTYPNKHEEYPPSPTWRASPTWRKQKEFPLPVEKSRESPEFFRGRGQSYARRHGTWNSLVVAACEELWPGAPRTICLTADCAMRNGQGQTGHQFHQNKHKRVNLRIKCWFLLNWLRIWLWIYTAGMEIVQMTPSKSDDLCSPCC